LPTCYFQSPLCYETATECLGCQTGNYFKKCRSSGSLLECNSCCMSALPGQTFVCCGRFCEAQRKKSREFGVRALTLTPANGESDNPSQKKRSLVQTHAHHPNTHRTCAQDGRHTKKRRRQDDDEGVPGLLRPLPPAPRQLLPLGRRHPFIRFSFTIAVSSHFFSSSTGPPPSRTCTWPPSLFALRFLSF
jgi:hypothetical protein